MELELNPLERLMVQKFALGIKEGNFYLFALMEDLLKECSFSEEELTQLGIKDNDEGNVQIEAKGMKHEKKIHIPDIIVAKLRKVILNLQKQDRPMQTIAQEASLVGKLYPNLLEDIKEEMDKEAKKDGGPGKSDEGGKE